MNNYSIGNRIKELRNQRGLSQEQLALKSGITTAYLGQIERSEKNPTIKSVEKISNVLDLSLSELFSNQEIKPRTTDKILESMIFEICSLSADEKSELLEIIKHIIKLKSLSPRLEDRD